MGEEARVSWTKGFLNLFRRKDADSRRSRPAAATCRAPDHAQEHGNPRISVKCFRQQGPEAQLPQCHLMFVMHPVSGQRLGETDVRRKEECLALRKAWERILCKALENQRLAVFAAASKLEAQFLKKVIESNSGWRVKHLSENKAFFKEGDALIEEHPYLFLLIAGR